MEKDLRVVDNTDQRRYELWFGQTRAGFIQYRSGADAVQLIHTEVDQAFAGQGLGGRLVAGALDDIRASGRRLVPICPFVRAYLRRHPEYEDLVASGPA